MKGGWPGQEHVANLSENGRKAMICSIYIVIITDIYCIIWRSFARILRITSGLFYVMGGALYFKC